MSAERLAAQLRELWDQVPFEADWQSEQQQEEATGTLEAFLAWHGARPDRNLIGVEVPFQVELEAGGTTVRLGGRIDRVERDAGGAVRVVDLKTGRTAVSKADVADNPALGAYQLAVQAGALADLDGADGPSGGAELVMLRQPDRTGKPKIHAQAAAAASRGRRSVRRAVGGGRPAGPGRAVRPRAVGRVRQVRVPALLQRPRPRWWADVSLAGPAAATAVREPADLCELLGVPYSDEQLAAITAGPDPSVVVAGAGSGKTTVIAARVVWLVATGAARPDEVLGLTFTNKAAAELAHRVRTALRRAALVPDPAVVGAHDEDPGEPSISTYHAYAADLIREHGLRLGIEPGARLLTDAARYQLAARVIRSAPGPIRSLTKSIKLLAPDLLALEAECSEHLVDLAELRSFDQQLIGRLEREPQASGVSSALGKALLAARRRCEFTDLVEAYRAAKHAGDLVDFGDQMALAACLAEQCPPVGVAERARHRVVVLDEYQDTSVAQRRMLVGLFGAGTR